MQRVYDLGHIGVGPAVGPGVLMRVVFLPEVGMGR
jgi:hypothetical protein